MTDIKVESYEALRQRLAEEKNASEQKKQTLGKRKRQEEETTALDQKAAALWFAQARWTQKAGDYVVRIIKKVNVEGTLYLTLQKEEILGIKVQEIKDEKGVVVDRKGARIDDGYDQVVLGSDQSWIDGWQHKVSFPMDGNMENTIALITKLYPNSISVFADRPSSKSIVKNTSE